MSSRAEVLPQRVLVHEALQLGDELLRTPAPQVGVQPQLDGLDPELIETSDLRLRK